MQHSLSVRRECLSITWSQYPLTERYRFFGFAPPSRGRLAVDIVNSAAHRTVLYSSVTGIDRDRLRYLSATGPRAGKSVLTLIDELLMLQSMLCNKLQ